MATDYDSPRKADDDLGEDSLQELQARRGDKASASIDLETSVLQINSTTAPVTDICAVLA